MQSYAHQDVNADRTNSHEENPASYNSRITALQMKPPDHTTTWIIFYHHILVGQMYWTTVNH